MTNFGLKIGTAFQLVDDVLDYSAEEKKLGKSIGKDFREGKVTLPLIYLYNRCSEGEKSWIRTSLVDKEITPKELTHLLKIMEKYEALKSTMELAESYIASAKEELKVFPDSLYLEALTSIADYTVSRDY